jgi:GNAT superfamily N-acetyltransferase
LTLEVCKDGTGENKDWIAVYEASFPPSQRQDLGDLERQLVEGSMELDETRDQYGDIMCMTLTEVFSGGEHPFLLACYTAVFPDMRGLGIGSIHRRKLAELLQSEYSGHLGLFSEIESTYETGLPPADLEVRTKRKAFFLKLGLKEIAVDYRFPSYTNSGEHLQGELLWLPFTGQELQPKMVPGILRRIYTEGYGLPADDPLINTVISSIRERKPVS